MSTAPDSSRELTLLREVASGPASVQLAALLRTHKGREPVALKLIVLRSPRSAENLLRLRDTSRALARLHHRHLVSPSELLQVGDELALLSPWVDGLDLAEWMDLLREQGLLFPARVVCEIVRSVSAGLEVAAHRVPWGQSEPLGLVHWDLKPTNVMVDRDGEVKVLDLGTGYTSLAGRVARTGALRMGLIKYVSPERREGKRGGPASDVYALGVITLEILRGRWLRRLHSRNPSHDRHLAEVVASMSEPGLRTATDDAALRNLLLRMLAWDPEARPPITEVAQTFRVLADRSRGPSLVSFAHDHLVPYLRHLPTEPDPELWQVEVRSVEQLPPDLALLPPERTRFSQHRPQAEWVETDRGWEQRPSSATPPPPWEAREVTEATSTFGLGRLDDADHEASLTLPLGDVLAAVATEERLATGERAATAPRPLGSPDPSRRNRWYTLLIASLVGLVVGSGLLGVVATAVVAVILLALR